MAENKTSNGIDFIGLILLLWSKRKQLLLACVVGGVLSIIVAFSIPKEYTTKVVMAPEFSASGMSASGGLGSLASMAGINLGGLGGGDDALYPELYPQIISSTPFLCDILSMNVVSKDGDINTDLYHYLRFEQKEPWWTTALTAPIRLLKRMTTTQRVDTIVPSSGSDKMLTRAQQMLMKSLDGNIHVDVDKGNNVISLGVTMQDPLISTMVAEKVMDNLQQYIGDYRSAKARKDLENTQKIYDEAQQKYYAAQQAYASYADQHMGTVLLQHQIEQERLEHERDLSYDVYNQLAGQLELARAKVQESTPVCVVMQPPIVPFKASSPKKMMIGLLYVFLAFFGTAAWFIIKEMVLKDRLAS